MNLSKVLSGAYLIVLTLGAALLFTACSQPSFRPEPDNLFWPAPPETPRIKYVQSIYREDDIGRVYSFTEKIFGKSYFDTIVRPYGVFAGHGKLLVTDIVARNVTLYDLVEKRLITVISGREARFHMPAAAVSDRDGNLYVADSGGTSLYLFDPRGIYKTTIKVPDGKPVGLALNERLGRLYVADREGHRVVVFDLQGRLLFEYGGRGVAEGKFNIPLDLAIDAQDRVYVLDSGNFRVQVFSPDGAYLSKFGEVGDRPGTFANPKGIALDSDGHIYVTDAAFSNFQIFDQQGRILLHVGEAGMQPGFLHLPAGIAIDENDRIYVADQINSRIQVFQYLKAKERLPQP